MVAGAEWYCLRDVLYSVDGGGGGVDADIDIPLPGIAAFVLDKSSFSSFASPTSLAQGNSPGTPCGMPPGAVF